MNLDLIIYDGIVLTMSGKGIGIIPEGAVGIKGNKIICVDDSKHIMKEYRAENVIDAKRRIIMPGFINAHTHSYYGVMCRGILTDLKLFLEQGAAGYLETLTIERKIAGVKAHLLEGIKRGVTTFCDQGEEYDKLAFIHDMFGVRARLSEMVREMVWDYRDSLGKLYSFERNYAEQSLTATQFLLDTYGADPENRISAMVSFQALDYASTELILELKELAEKNHAMIHTHMAQSPYEIEQVELRYGARPVEVFEKLGLLNDNTLAAHLLYNTVAENEKAAKSGMKMAYCPYSFCQVGASPPAAQYIHFGGTVGIGSDEAAYTGVNPISDMKSAHLNANVDAFHHKMPNVPLGKILRMHTIEAAAAIGMEKQIGSLEPGKKADLILLNPYTVNLTPVLISPLSNVVQNIVSAATGNEVETVIVNGKIIMEDGVLKTINEEPIIKAAQLLSQEAAEKAYEYYKKLPDSEVLTLQRQFFYE